MLRNLLLVLCVLVLALCLTSLAEETMPRYKIAAQEAYHQGLVYDSLGQISNASFAYQRAVNSDPTLADAWYRLGLVHYAVSDKFDSIDKALDCFRKAVELDPALDVWDKENRPIPPILVNSKEDWELWKQFHSLQNSSS